MFPLLILQRPVTAYVLVVLLSYMGRNRFKKCQFLSLKKCYGYRILSDIACINIILKFSFFFRISSVGVHRNDLTVVLLIKLSIYFLTSILVIHTKIFTIDIYQAVFRLAQSHQGSRPQVWFEISSLVLIVWLSCQPSHFVTIFVKMKKIKETKYNLFFAFLKVML